MTLRLALPPTSRLLLVGAATAVGLALLHVALAVPDALRADVRHTLPSLVLWAWERPEDLRFLDPRQHGVAVLVGTIDLSGADIHPKARRQPLKIPTHIRAIAVVRLESDPARPPTLSGKQLRRTVEAVLEWTDPAEIGLQVEGLQIDFDATVSERGFYRRLLTDLRRHLPSHLSLQMTALASWCLADAGLEKVWLDDLPVDFVVPMLFRMGPDTRTIRQRIETGGDLRAGICRSSLGISTDEPLARLPIRRPLFVFHHRPWTKDAFDTLRHDLEEIRR